LVFAILVIFYFGFSQFRLSERNKEIETLKSQAKIQILNKKLDIRFLTNQVLVQTQKVMDQENYITAQDKKLQVLQDQINVLNTKLRESKEFKPNELDGIEWMRSGKWKLGRLNGYPKVEDNSDSSII
jgi:hypothetical protein